MLLERLQRGYFYSVSDFYGRVTVQVDALEALVRAGAFDRLHSRRDALFELEALKNIQTMGEQPLFSGIPKVPSFAKMPIGHRLQSDIALKGYSELEVHPLDLIRQQLYYLGVTPLGLLQRRLDFRELQGWLFQNSDHLQQQALRFMLWRMDLCECSLLFHLLFGKSPRSA